MARNDGWNELREDYQTRGLILALGAGVSVDCKLPAWNELLCRLAARCLGRRGRNICRRLIKSGYTFPAIASFIEAACPPTSDFSEIVRQELYRDFKFFPKGTGDNRQGFIDFVQKKNPTLRAVASLCARPSLDSESFSPNPLIHAVVNFNLDAVLQAYLKSRYKTRLYRTIERASARSKTGKINIYHMHGFFKFNEDAFGDLGEEAPDVRVFTEQEYFDFFNQPNNLFNYTFLYLLREFSSLFIGMSMKDDNVRRLLHYSMAERNLSYVREGRKKERAEEKSVRHYAILQRSSKGIDEFMEVSLKRLGTRVLWVREFTEIPGRLGKLYNSTGDKWDDVY